MAQARIALVILVVFFCVVLVYSCGMPTGNENCGGHGG
jgi:hypothetical protein